VVVSRIAGNLDIWRIDLIRGKAKASTRILTSPYQDMDPQFSPDGKKIAFVSDRVLKEAVWVSDRDGVKPKDLTLYTIEQYSRGPRWSPNGQEISFITRTSSGGDIYVINADGGTARRVTAHPDTYLYASWSRNGTSLYFSVYRRKIGAPNESELWKIPVNGGAAVEIAREGVYAEESTDERYLYFSKGVDVPNPEHKTSLWRRDRAGKEEMIVDALAGGSAFTVTEDGIYFVPFSNPNVRTVIQFYRAADGKISEVAAIDKMFSGGFSVSTDGSAILLGLSDKFGFDLIGSTYRKKG
jgi:Tol biopolymer transport system component